MQKNHLKEISQLIILSFALLFSDKLTHASDSDFDLLMIPSIIASAKNTPLGNRPGPLNTGPIGQLTKMSGAISVEQDGAVIENVDLTGCISISADNVIIRNVRIDCDGFYAIRMNSGYVDLMVENAEMLNMRSAAILGSNFTIKHSNIHDSGADAFKPGRNVLIESSWLHRLGTIENSHSDGVQMVSGGDVIIRGNYFDMPASLQGYTNSQCILLQTNNGPIANILVEKNWLNGGGWCVQVNDKGRGHGSPQNIRIVDNVFGPDCAFGTILVRGENTDTTLNGNIFDLTGREIGVDEPVSSCGNDFD